MIVNQKEGLAKIKNDEVMRNISGEIDDEDRLINDCVSVEI